MKTKSREEKLIYLKGRNDGYREAMHDMKNLLSPTKKSKLRKMS